MLHKREALLDVSIVNLVQLDIGRIAMERLILRLFPWDSISTIRMLTTQIRK